MHLETQTQKKWKERPWLKKKNLDKLAFGIMIIIFLASLFSYFQANLYLSDRYLWHVNMASKYNDIGEYDKALQHVNKALLLDNKRIEIRRKTISRYIGYGEFDRAKEELYFLNGSAYYYWGMGYISLTEGNINESMEYFKNGIESHPSAGINYLGAGLVYLRLNETEQAFAYLNSSIAMIEENHGADSIKGKGLLGMAHAGLGIIYKREGSVQQADWQFNTAESINPRSVQRVSILMN